MNDTKDTVLRFEYSTNINADPRTIKVNQIVEGSGTQIEFYKVLAGSSRLVPPLSTRSASIKAPPM